MKLKKLSPGLIAIVALAACGNNGSTTGVPTGGTVSTDAKPVQVSLLPVLTPGEFSLHLRRTF